MKEYVSPNAEIIDFGDEQIIAASGCNCHYDISAHNMSIGGDVSCEAETGDASENPFGIAAPSWSF